MTRSVRFRITALAVMTFVVVAVLSGLALVVQQRATLTENVDDAVEQRAQDLVALTRSGIGDLELRGGDDIVAQIVDRTGRVVAASAQLPGQDLLFPPLDGSFDRGTTVLPEVDRARYVSMAADLGGADPGVVHVAGSLDDVEEATAELTAASPPASPSWSLCSAPRSGSSSGAPFDPSSGSGPRWRASARDGGVDGCPSPARGTRSIGSLAR